MWSPEYDGDGLFASIDPRPVTSDAEIAPSSVFQAAILPILLSLGFSPAGQSQFAIPKDKHTGIPVGQVRLSKIAERICNEFPADQHASAKPPRVSSQPQSATIHLVHSPDPVALVAPAGSVAGNREAFDRTFRAWTDWWCRLLERAGDKDQLASLGKDYPAFLAAIDPLFLNQTGLTLQQFVQEFQRQEYFYFFPQIHRPQRGEFAAELSLPKAVTIDHAGVRATRRERETVYSVTGRVLVSYGVANKVTHSPTSAAAAAVADLKKLEGVSKVEAIPAEWVSLVLLPTGEVKRDAFAQPALRYAYRMPAYLFVNGVRGLVYLWLDAEDGKLLELYPLFGGAGGQDSARGNTLHRDPTFLSNVDRARFRLDPPLPLKVDGELQGDPVSSLNFAHPAPAPGSDWDFTNVPLPTISELNSYIGSSDVEKWQKIDLFATVYRYMDLVTSSPLTIWDLSSLVTQPFPPQDIPVKLHFGLWTCEQRALSGYSSLTLELHAYPKNFSCPATVLPANAEVSKAYHDHTLVAHEMGHLLTMHQYDYGPPETPPRPQTNWCGSHLFPSPIVCPLPMNPQYFHDLADAWVQVFEHTNCVAGWMGKWILLGSLTKPFGDDSPHCKKHHEGGGWPRLSSVPDPVQFDLSFNLSSVDPATVDNDTWNDNYVDYAAKVGDHFPEHRRIFNPDPINNPTTVPEYADMQIAAAALWEVRQGARSITRFGHVDYFIRFVRALATTGWLGDEPLTNPCRDMEGPQCIRRDNEYSDRDVYRGLVDLEVKLANQWRNRNSVGVYAITRTVNKVAAGFARAGIFMIHPACLDHDPSNNGPCPEGDSGGDAVIDVNDDNCADDWITDGTGDPCNPASVVGVLNQERDYLRPGMPVPGFHVWTGPRYVFSDNIAVHEATPQCNNVFMIEVAEDEAFTQMLATSAWLETSLTRPCYCNWTFSLSEWNNITQKLAQDGKDRIYYRLTTCKMPLGSAAPCDSSPAAMYYRSSTRPANGLFGEVPPPYAIVNATGTYPVLRLPLGLDIPGPFDIIPIEPPIPAPPLPGPVPGPTVLTP